MNKKYWLKGGVYGASVSIIILLFTWLGSYFFWKPDPNAWVEFSPFAIVVWLMAYPIQAIANFFLGEDNFFEKHLLLISAVLTLFLIGVILGWIYGKIKNRNKIV